MTPEVLEALSNSIDYKYDISKDKDGNVVVGEVHLCTNLPLENKKEVDSLLEQNKDSVFIIEGDMRGSGWDEAGNTSNTVMDRTRRFAEENNKPLEILDNEDLVNSKNGYRYKLWEHVGSQISEYDYNFTLGLYHVREAFMLYRRNPKEVYENIINSPRITETTKNIFLTSLKTFLLSMQTGNPKEQLNKIDTFCQQFIIYDGTCRERFYQEKISEIKESHAEKKIFAVFGNTHKEGIAKTIEDTNYRTPFKGEAKMIWEIQEFKEIANQPISFQ